MNVAYDLEKPMLNMASIMCDVHATCIAPAPPGCGTTLIAYRKATRVRMMRCVCYNLSRLIFTYFMSSSPASYVEEPYTGGAVFGRSGGIIFIEKSALYPQPGTPEGILQGF